MRSRLLDIILPPRCGGCHMVGTWLCDRCRSRIRRLEEPLCRRCGAEVESARSGCGCRKRLRSLSRLRSAVAYEGPVEVALQRFKYHGWRRLAEPLALLLAERLVVEGLAASWAVAVPLHRSRQRQRGFNQSELLARELRRRLALTNPPGELVRTRATPPQVGHDRRWRLENVRDAFEWRGGPLEGRSILLIDDVATTGATLEACAAALRSGGSGPVMGVSVARVTV
ncbi:MAG TPA: double zinc ribbon domain-containing protein [Candidatus Nitrosotalea sp.]|nr:double zinc ribbon domain-containing protein [Candidatus Nitrosotalea sp.]